MNNGFKNISKQGMSLHLYNKKNGMLASGYEDMKICMQEILKDKTLQKNIQDSAKKTVKEKFQLFDRGTEILNAYNKMIGMDGKMATNK